MLLKLFLWHKTVQISELTFFKNRANVDIIMVFIKITISLFLIYILNSCFIELVCVVVPFNGSGNNPSISSIALEFLLL